MNCGAKIAPARRPAARAEAPSDVKASLSPAALVYVFKESFLTPKELKSVEGGDYRPLIPYMVAATLFTLESDGIVTLQPGKRGRILKKDTVMVYKRRNFKLGNYGILSQKVYGLPIGGTLTAYDVLFDPAKKKSLSDPVGYVVNLVHRRDVGRKTWNFLFGKRKVLVKRRFFGPKEKTVEYLKPESARLYHGQLSKLRSVFDSYLADPVYRKMFRAIKEECDRALFDMLYVETGY